MTDEANGRANGKSSALVTGAAGAGAGVIVATILQGQPEIVSQIASWGPGVLILAGFAWIARPAIDSHRLMAENVGKLSSAIQATLDRDQDVRMAVNTLAGEMRDLAGELRKHMLDVQAQRGHV